MLIGNGSLAGLAMLRDFERERLSSYDRSGGNADYLSIEPGATVEFGRIDGAGCVKHTWMTVMAIPEHEPLLRALRYRVYWDGSAEPAVDVPLGDFHGVGFGLRRNMVSLPLQMSPQDVEDLVLYQVSALAGIARSQRARRHDLVTGRDHPHKWTRHDAHRGQRPGRLGGGAVGGAVHAC